MNTLETEIPIEVETPNVPKNKIKLLYIIILLLTLVTIGLITIICSIYSPVKNTEVSTPIEETDTNTPMEEAGKPLDTSKINTDSYTTPNESNGLLTYTNKRLGFSIDIPETAFSLYGGCQWVEDEDAPSYRPKEELTPVTTFEEDNGVYIAFKYAYELMGRKEVNGYSTFSECEKKDNTLEILKSENRTWHIITEEIKDDTALTNFIKDQFGSSCSLGEKTESTQEGVYDVKVKGDGLDMEYSNCVVNYMYVLRYSPVKQRVYTFDRGQSFAFPQLSDFSKVYDDTMEDSFKIL